MTTLGIGRETAIGFADLGATLIFTTRNGKQGAKTRNEISKATNNDNVQLGYDLI